MGEIDAAYYAAVRTRTGIVARTVEVTDSTLVDVDEEGRVLGVETIGDANVAWWAIFADERFRFQWEEKWEDLSPGETTPDHASRPETV